MKNKLLIMILITGSLVMARCNGSSDEAAKEGYYTCSMHPQVISQKPGTCPICGMDLTYIEAQQSDEHKDHAEQHKNKNGEGSRETSSPEKAGNDTGKRVFTLKKEMLANARLATSPVRVEPFSKEGRYTAHIDFNETPRRYVIINTKYDGWIEKLSISKEGDRVRKGGRLFGIYSPEVLAAKEEYITTRLALSEIHSHGSVSENTQKLKNDPTLKAARQKLLYLDVPASDIERLDSLENAPRLTTYRSPISGVVISKKVVRGAHIRAGEEIMRIADLRRLWVFIHIFEHDLSFIKKGQKVTLRTKAYPGETYTGRVDLIYPFVNPETRDLKIRISVRNNSLKLKPGMFAEVEINSLLSESAHTIPSTAVIYSGSESYVFLSLGSGRFKLQPVTVKAVSDQRAMITGLSENELVVTNGQFMLDSEASMKSITVTEGSDEKDN